MKHVVELVNVSMEVFLVLRTLEGHSETMTFCPLVEGGFQAMLAVVSSVDRRCTHFLEVEKAPKWHIVHSNYSGSVSPTLDDLGLGQTAGEPSVVVDRRLVVQPKSQGSVLGSVHRLTPK